MNLVFARPSLIHQIKRSVSNCSTATALLLPTIAGGGRVSAALLWEDYVDWNTEAVDASLSRHAVAQETCRN